MITQPMQLFETGRTLITENAKSELEIKDCTKGLIRHLHGDWGDLCDEDKASNDLALKDGGRLLSSYVSAQGVTFWIITEADRSVTTILLPEDY